jgi:hypothetical protein
MTASVRPLCLPSAPFTCAIPVKSAQLLPDATIPSPTPPATAPHKAASLPREKPSEGGRRVGRGGSSKAEEEGPIEDWEMAAEISASERPLRRRKSSRLSGEDFWVRGSWRNLKDMPLV